MSESFVYERYLCSTKISIEEHGYSFSREWPEDELDTERPEVDDAVDAALYLMSCVYPGEEVERAAREWEI